MATNQRATHTKVIQDTLDRIARHNGVYGYLILHPKDGHILQSSGFEDNKKIAENYAEKLVAFLSVTQSTVRTISHSDDLTFLRMRWRLREIIIAPDLNREYVLIVVHDQAAHVAGAQAQTGLQQAEHAVGASPTTAEPPAQ